jgi:outer membrane protein assembly factor BamB
MFRKIRYAGLVLVGAGLLALLFLVLGLGKMKRPEVPGKTAPVLVLPAEIPPLPPETEAIVLAELAPSLRADAVLAGKLDAARDYLQRESWTEAFTALQALLDHTDDTFIAVQREDDEGSAFTTWSGIRAEAARLISTLPAVARAFYEVSYGPQARALFTEALQNGDARLIASVARRFPGTAAGAEACNLLGDYHLDRARATLAAVCFQRALERSDADTLSPATLFHAALAFRRSGDSARAEQVWTRLATKAPEGVPLGGSMLGLADLRKELDRVGISSSSPAARVADGASGLESRWTRSTAHESLTQEWLHGNLRRLEGHGQPVLPAFFPITVGDRVVYRSYRGLHAVDPETGQQVWEARSRWSVDQLIADSSFRPFLHSWITETYEETSPHVLFSNALLGTLSTDGQRVYAVDDLGVPPPRVFQRGGRWRQPEEAWPNFPQDDLNKAVCRSVLIALDAASGKRVWEVGGRAQEPEMEVLSDSYFLGAPLLLDGRLYALTEKAGQLNLVCLRADSGAFLWQQPLALAPTGLVYDPGRRIHTAQPVYGEGVVVCPTHAGIVVGVDLLTQGLLWAYPYRTGALTQAKSIGFRRGRTSPPGLTAAWPAPKILVQDGRVLFTAADEPSIHCLSLRDGSLLWRAGRTEDDLYLAGAVAGKVLLVGKQACRALDLSDGRPVWRVQTGLPSGQGILSGEVYYLPVREPGRGAVCAIQVRNGILLSRTPSQLLEGLGNLLLSSKRLFSQTATAVALLAPSK